MEIDKPMGSGCAQRSDCNDDSGCAYQSFDDNNNYNPASDFDHYQEDPEFDNGRAGIKEDNQRDQNMKDMSLRDSSTAGMS